MIKILYEDNHLLCVEKPAGIPVQPDGSGDTSMLDLCRAYLKETYHKPGNAYCGLVHRLDRPVGGAMVFAKTSKAASRLSETIRTHRMLKVYLAVLDGIPKARQGTLRDFLYKDHRTNMVTVDPAKGRPCELSYVVMGEKKGKTLVMIRLATGRSHQIRVQFASRNLPLVHDQRYNPAPGKGTIALWSWHLEFPHPVTRETVAVESDPHHIAPWTLFEEELYDD
jgi:23S rRNA pseudouridine1911/1915/1917 synthase